MKPYQHINYILQSLLRDSIGVDIKIYTFDENDARWRISIENPMEWNGPQSGASQYSNLYTSNHMGNSNGYYDFNEKKWRNFDDKPRVLGTVIDHGFEPVQYELDEVLWERKYWKFHPWPSCRISNDMNTFMQIKDYPIYVLHSEHNSKDINKLNELGYKTIHWFSHAFLCSEYYFKMYSNLDMVTNYHARPIKSPWISANRLLRQHRTDFLEMLDLSKGCYSLLNPDPNGLTYDGPVPARSFDDHTNSSAEIEIQNLTPWNTSFLHVVSETVWQEKIHFTEKVFKPIVLHQPFVVLQAPGSLEYLRSYGFKTFGAWWDEGYDAIEDPAERMQAIADIVNAIGAKSLEELETMRMEMASVLEHNFRHFYENIPAICLDELRKDIATL